MFYVVELHRLEERLKLNIVLNSGYQAKTVGLRSIEVARIAKLIKVVSAVFVFKKSLQSVCVIPGRYVESYFNCEARCRGVDCVVYFRS